jgi:hypothetical protein
MFILVGKLSSHVSGGIGIIIKDIATWNPYQFLDIETILI